MSQIYIVLLAIAAFSVSIIGATFSVVGLTSLFAGAVISVGLMAASLEFAKVVTAGFLYRYWGHVGPLMRIYLAGSVVILSMITSMGIFGYLSNAYQRSSVAYKTLQLEIGGFTQKNLMIREEIEKTEKFIEEVPSSRISKKFALYEQSRNHIKNLRQQSQEINQQVEAAKLKMLDTQTELGPIVYTAEALDTSVDNVAKYLILVFVSVFDPLAICLVFALGLAIRLREKYKGDEYRIGKMALTQPVDHRFKKSA